MQEALFHQILKRNQGFDMKGYWQVGNFQSTTQWLKSECLQPVSQSLRLPFATTVANPATRSKEDNIPQDPNIESCKQPFPREESSETIF